jgi:hypothetical protein
VLVIVGTADAVISAWVPGQVYAGRGLKVMVLNQVKQKF